MSDLRIASLYLVLIGFFGDQLSTALILGKSGLENEGAFLLHFFYEAFGLSGIILWAWIEVMVVMGAVYLVYLVRRRYTAMPAEYLTSSIITAVLLYIAAFNILALANSGA